MDPVSLAAGAVQLVVPFLAKKGDELASRLGEEVWAAVAKKATQLWQAIKARFSGDEESRQRVEGLEREPEDPARQTEMQEALAGSLERDADFRETLQTLVDEVRKAGGDRVIQVYGSGAAASEGGVAAGEGGYAAGGDIHIGTPPRPEDQA